MIDAAMLMGRVPRGPGRPRYDDGELKADLDPAAWWCLVELLVAYAEGRKG